ncbi:alpha/beta hydrolase family protein [Flindersiella endophytica]
MAGNDRESSVVARFAGAGRTAELISTIDPEFPWWFRLRLDDTRHGAGGGWVEPLPPHLRLAGPLTWAPDGSALAVPAFRGIRRGIILVDPQTCGWRWATPDDEASYVDPVLQPGSTEVAAIRLGLDGTRAQVRLSPQAPAVRREGAASGSAAEFRLLSWRVPEGVLEGVLALPHGTRSERLPLVVLLHGGPVGAFQAGDADQLAQWTVRGYAAFQPEFRASGILGPEPMLCTFQGVGLPGDDPEVHDVLAGVAAAMATDRVDPGRVFAIGYSYGGYLLNRLLTGRAGHPFRAAVCWEGLADLRLLDGDSLRLQSRWRGGPPAERPEAWAAASPIERAGRVGVPLLLAYGEQGNATPHGEAWHAALRAQQVECSLVVHPGEGHVFGADAEHALADRAVAWFAAAASTAGR